MNALDIIIKNKLWSLLKEKESLDKALLNYIFWNSKTDLLEQIKTKDILEDMFLKILESSYPLKNEKKLFMFLLKELGENYIKDKIRKEDSFNIAYNWLKRQQNKSIQFKEFLDYIPEVHNGLLLYVAIILKDERLINYSITKNKQKTFEMEINSKLFINDKAKISINFITDSSFKSEQRIFLLNKFNCDDNELIDIFNKSLNEKDIMIIHWILSNKIKTIENNKSKLYLPKNINKELEKILLDNIYLFKENDYTMNKIFSLMMDINSLNETLKKFESSNYKFNYYSREILNKFINESNYQELLKTNILKEEDIIKRVWKLSITLDDKISFTQKYLKTKLNNSDSLDILFENLTEETKEKIINANVFDFSYLSLFSYFFNKNDELCIFLAKNIEKKDILKYKNSIPEKNHKKFDLIYFSSLLENKKIEKRHKI